MTLNKPFKFNYKNIIIILVGALLLCYTAFVNRYPIVDIDSYGYIMSGFHNYVDLFRPSFYGIFLKYASLKITPWLVIYIQAIILSYLLFKFFNSFVVEKALRIIFICVVLTLVAFTNVSYYVSELMPDIFTPILILSLTLLYFSKQNLLIEKIWLCLFICLSILFHNSNILISAIVIPLNVLIAFLINRRTNQNFVSNYRLMSLISMCLLIFSVTIIANRNNIIKQHPKHDYNTPIFLLDRLDETGVLEIYLNDNCSKESLHLCAYKDSFKYNFLWDYKNSPVYKNGGWESDSNYYEYWHILKKVATTPKYLKIILYKSVIKSGIMFFSFGRESLTRQIKTDISCYWAIKDCFPQDLTEYNADLQNTGQLTYKEENSRQALAVFISFIFILVYAIFSPEQFFPLKYVVIFMTTTIFINAMACGIFSSITLRYQDRVIWLFPLILIALVLRTPLIQSRLNKISR